MSDNYRVLRALRLYLVLDPGLCGGSEGLVRTAQAAAAAGVTAVQLRAPNWKKRLYAECGRELLKVLAPYDVPLFINDHADVAVAIGAHGVHVGQSDLSPEDCHRLMTPDMMLGLSVSNVSECLGVDPALVDYIGIGPYRATPTKKDAAAEIGLSGLTDIVSRAPCPSVAIGGIKAADVGSLDAADGDRGTGRTADDVRQARKTDFGSRILLGGRSPVGTDADVVDERRIHAEAFRHVGDRKPEHHVGRHQAMAVFRREIRLADMHAVSADGDGDVRVVVDEERHVVRGEHLEELPAAFGIKALLPVGSPELHGRDACRGSGLRRADQALGAAAETGIKHQIKTKSAKNPVVVGHDGPHSADVKSAGLIRWSPSR